MTGEAVDLDAHIGGRVRELRQQAGMSLGALCDAVNAAGDLGLVPGALSKAETGGRHWRIGELLVIASCLGVGLPALLEGPEVLSTPLEGWTGDELAEVAGSRKKTPKPVEVQGQALAARARLLHQLEQLVATRSGMTLREVQKWAKRAYGHDLWAERQGRAVDVMLTYGYLEPESGRQQALGQITRQLIEEAQAWLERKGRR